MRCARAEIKGSAQFGVCTSVQLCAQPLVELCGGMVALVGQQHTKLFATHACGQVAAAAGLHENTGEEFQRPVAGFMALAVSASERNCPSASSRHATSKATMPNTSVRLEARAKARLIGWGVRKCG